MHHINVTQANKVVNVIVQYYTTFVSSQTRCYRKLDIFNFRTGPLKLHCASTASNAMLQLRPIKILLKHNSISLSLCNSLTIMPYSSMLLNNTCALKNKSEKVRNSYKPPKIFFARVCLMYPIAKTALIIVHTQLTVAPSHRLHHMMLDN